MRAIETPRWAYLSQKHFPQVDYLASNLLICLVRLNCDQLIGGYVTNPFIAMPVSLASASSSFAMEGEGPTCGGIYYSIFNKMISATASQSITLCRSDYISIHPTPLADCESATFLGNTYLHHVTGGQNDQLRLSWVDRCLSSPHDS